MTTTKRSGAHNSKINKLKLKKETIKDLDVKKKGKSVRGGMAIEGVSEPIKDCCPCRSTTAFSDPKVIC